MRQTSSCGFSHSPSAIDAELAFRDCLTSATPSFVPRTGHFLNRIALVAAPMSLEFALRVKDTVVNVV